MYLTDLWLIGFSKRVTTILSLQIHGLFFFAFFLTRWVAGKLSMCASCRKRDDERYPIELPAEREWILRVVVFFSFFFRIMRVTVTSSHSGHDAASKGLYAYCPVSSFARAKWNVVYEGTCATAIRYPCWSEESTATQVRWGLLLVQKASRSLYLLFAHRWHGPSRTGRILPRASRRSHHYFPSLWEILHNARELKMYGTYILNQKFDSIRISVLYDKIKIWRSNRQCLRKRSKNKYCYIKNATDSAWFHNYCTKLRSNECMIYYDSWWRKK